MAEKKYFGFASYVETGKITDEFIKDFEYWTRRIYRQWSLFLDFDEFYSICWCALLSKIKEFDPKIATIQTFCISRINNEAWRFYMKCKNRRIEIDSDDPVIQGDLVAADDRELNNTLYDFELYLSSLGIRFNKKEFIKEYTEGKRSSPMIAFAAWRRHSDEIGWVKNDILKR